MQRTSEVWVYRSKLYEYTLKHEMKMIIAELSTTTTFQKSIYSNNCTARRQQFISSGAQVHFHLQTCPVFILYCSQHVEPRLTLVHFMKGDFLFQKIVQLCMAHPCPVT